MQSESTRKNVWVLFAIFFVFLLVWVAFNWPALFTVWWAIDDYSHVVNRENLYHITLFRAGLQSGRPVNFLIFWMKRLIFDVDPAFANVTLRWLQVCIHVYTALLIAYVLKKETKLDVPDPEKAAKSAELKAQAMAILSKAASK